jgi:cytochrome bd-type quinol oxidase subunit 2
MTLGKLVHYHPVFPLLCGMAMVSGYALLGSAWLVYKASGTTQTFGREVSRAAWLLTMALFALACFWTAPQCSQRLKTLVHVAWRVIDYGYRGGAHCGVGRLLAVNLELAK